MPFRSIHEPTWKWNCFRARCFCKNIRIAWKNIRRKLYKQCYSKNCVDIKSSVGGKTKKFKGSSKEEIVAGEDFCPGTYRFYAKVLNYDDHYNVIYRTSSGSLHSKYYSVWKSAGNLNDEGSKIAFDDESVLEIDPGITEIRLVK